MKKFVSILLALCCTVFCFGTCAFAAEDNRVVIYTAAEDERIAYLQEELDRQFPDYEIVFQSLGTGQLLSKLQAEGENSDCDIFYDLEVVNAEIILNANPDLFVDLSDYDFSVYDSSVTGYTDRHHRYAVNGKTAGAFLVVPSEQNEEYSIVTPNSNYGLRAYDYIVLNASAVNDDELVFEKMAK